MIVVDSSAVLVALLADPPAPGLRERLADEELHAPHLLDTEILHALRRLVAHQQLTVGRAHDALTDVADLTIIRAAHHPLSARVWELRENLTSYDATFVALAEALDAPLLTADRRLARAPGHAARVELVTPR